MTVEDAIYIEAAPDVVWGVAVDVEQWPKWTPTVTSVVRLEDGPFEFGSTTRIKQPGQPESEWTVTEFVPGQRFVWETRRPGLRMRASHKVKADGSGTANVLRLEVVGIVGVLLWPVLQWAVRRALTQENRGLKTHCEVFSEREARL